MPNMTAEASQAIDNSILRLQIVALRQIFIRANIKFDLATGITKDLKADEAADLDEYLSAAEAGDAPYQLPNEHVHTLWCIPDLEVVSEPTTAE